MAERNPPLQGTNPNLRPYVGSVSGASEMKVPLNPRIIAKLNLPKEVKERLMDAANEVVPEGRVIPNKRSNFHDN